MSKIKCVVLGFHGCVYNKFGDSIKKALLDTFKYKSLLLKENDITITSGLKINKRILHILTKDHIKSKWEEYYGETPNYNDSLKLEEDFYKIYDVNTKYEFLPGVEDILELLKKKNIKLILNSEQKNHNFHHDIFDYVINENDKIKPYSLWKILENLNINDLNKVVNIDSTVPGLLGGKKSNLINVGVNEFSPYINNLSNDLNIEMEKSFDILNMTNPNFMIQNFYELDKIEDLI